MYAPNTRALKINKAKTGKIEGEIDSSTIIAGAFSIPLSIIEQLGRSARKRKT